MISKCCIVIFTQNRHLVLEQSLFKLNGCGYDIYLIDDSHDPKSIEINRDLCSRYNIFYYGQAAQTCLLGAIAKKGYILNNVLKVLGDGKWNLGFARNHALLLCAMEKIDKVLFLDDDIKIEGHDFINNIFSLLDRFELVGAEIVGMVDDSILGHIATDVGYEFSRMASGGCIGFDTRKMNHYFINIYNEDWIWQYFQFYNSRVVMYGKAWQDLYDPFDVHSDKMVFQEMGEIVVDAIQNIQSQSKWEVLMDMKFWATQRQERVEYLRELCQRCLRQKKIRFVDIISNLLFDYPIECDSRLEDIFVEYFKNQPIFEKLYMDLRSN